MLPRGFVSEGTGTMSQHETQVRIFFHRRGNLCGEVSETFGAGRVGAGLVGDE
jgi:hypothetical protein